MNDKLKKYVSDVYAYASSIRKMVELGHTVESQDLQEEAIELLTYMEGFVDYIEDEDLKAKKGKIKPAGEYFDNSVKSDYVDFKLTSLLDKPENVYDRLVKDTQDYVDAFSEIFGTLLDRDTEEEEDGVPVATIEDYVGYVIDNLGFNNSEEDYKEKFKGELKKAVETVREGVGIAHFFVIIDGETKQGSIAFEGDTVVIEVDGTEYQFTEPDDLPRYLGIYDEEDDDDDEEPSCGCNDYSDCYCEDLDEEEESGILTIWEDGELIFSGSDLHNKVEDFDETVTHENINLMEEIEKELRNKNSYTDSEIELMRFYLKKLPFNSEYDIEELSDRAVVLGFKKHLYTKGN